MLRCFLIISLAISSTYLRYRDERIAKENAIKDEEDMIKQKELVIPQHYDLLYLNRPDQIITHKRPLISMKAGPSKFHPLFIALIPRPNLN